MKLKDLQPILDICAKIEEETNYCLFISYRGHTKGVHLTIIELSREGTKEVYSALFFLDRWESEELNKCIYKLNKILEDGKNKYNILCKLKNNEIKEQFEKQIALGVPKVRAIKNVSEEFEITQVKLKEVLNG